MKPLIGLLVVPLALVWLVVRAVWLVLVQCGSWGLAFAHVAWLCRGYEYGHRDITRPGRLHGPSCGSDPNPVAAWTYAAGAWRFL